MRRAGFTLVELVVTMVLLAILALGVTSYIGLGARMYTDAAEREQVLGQSRFVIERMVRELRNAAPNSVRINATELMSCMEFTPVATSGLYSILPVAPESDVDISLRLFGFKTNPEYIPLIALVIYPTSDVDYYGVSSRRIMLTSENAAALRAVPTEPPTGATINLTLASAHSFPAHSPEQRFYVLQQSVSYCFSAGQIRRLVGHNYNTTMPAVGSGVLMAEGLRAAVFRVTDAVLTRNSVVNIFLQFGYGGNADMFFNYEVHIPNVP